MVYQVYIPLWRRAARDHGDWFAIVKCLLPVGEVDDGAEVVPGEDAGHASADLQWIERLDVLVGFFVDGEEVLTFGGEEGGVVFWIEG